MVLKFLILVFFVESSLCNVLKNDDETEPVEVSAYSSLYNCAENCKKISEPVSLKFYLYTRKSAGIEENIIPNNEESIKNSNFDPERPTRFITHGFMASAGSLINSILVEAFLHNDELNVFFVDWSSCAKRINYFKARCCIEDVGTQIAAFVDFLNSNFALKFEDLLLTGHSLGAHVMGYAGKKVNNGRINTIVGLDPAKPCFQEDLIDERLADSDAEYVESIHTNGDGLGFMIPIGHASFYPNWGKIQKGCIPWTISTCSHSLSYEFYAESIIDNNFVATQCENYDALLNKDCDKVVNLKMGGNPSNHGSSPKGIFFLPTNKEYPYGVGFITNK